MLKSLTQRWTWPRRTKTTGENHSPLLSSGARVSLSQDGAVFLNTCSGVIFTSNRTGAWIWQGLRDRESVDSIASRISLEHGVPHDLARRDTTNFIAELETQGFLSRGLKG
jgi:hypothetical protein